MANSDNFKHNKVTSREEQFAEGIATNVWQESPSDANPYIAEEIQCRGYELDELRSHCSYPDMLFLMLSGELPTTEQSDLFELTLKLFISPGPRHPATLATMNAAVSRTKSYNLLPIGQCALTGEYLGATEVSNAMQLISKNSHRQPRDIANKYLNSCQRLPGFGTLYGGLDTYTGSLAKKVQQQFPHLKHLGWGTSLVASLAEEQGAWLVTGLAAALYLDLGFNYKQGCSLFQFMQSPGLIAHGMEKLSSPITDMPFIKDQDYEFKG